MKERELERQLLEECGHFKDAGKGVPQDDVFAAWILKRANRMEILQLLHERLIGVVGDVNEDTKVEDLRFRAK